MELATFGPANDPRKWVSCANLIAARIASGEYPDGSWLPKYAELGAELSESAGLVHQAFMKVCAKGLISHVPGVGYYVGTGDPPGNVQPKKARGEKRQQGERPGNRRSALLAQEYVTPKELAAALRVSPMSVYRAIQDGEISGILRPGGKSLRIPVDSAEAWLESSRVDGGQLILDDLDDDE